MTFNGWFQIALYSVIVVAVAKLIVAYRTLVFNGERTFLSPVLLPVERVLYGMSRVDEKEEQHWLTYAVAMLAFSLLGLLSLYAIQRLQNVLPFNPQNLPSVSDHLAFNTA